MTTPIFLDTVTVVFSFPAEKIQGSNCKHHSCSKVTINFLRAAGEKSSPSLKRKRLIGKISCDDNDE
jgi:hypothetical protein